MGAVAHAYTTGPPHNILFSKFDESQHNESSSTPSSTHSSSSGVSKSASSFSTGRLSIDFIFNTVLKIFMNCLVLIRSPSPHTPILSANPFAASAGILLHNKAFSKALRRRSLGGCRNDDTSSPIR